MSNELMRKEILEAIQAGEQALSSLQSAEEKLDSAKSWGIFDMLGGGLISGLVKHSKMNDASGYMEDAKRNLRIFQRELKDVQMHTDLKIDIGEFLSFADFFFDGIVADVMVQSKISDAKDQVGVAITQVECLLRELKQQYNLW